MNAFRLLVLFLLFSATTVAQKEAISTPKKPFGKVTTSSQFDYAISLENNELKKGVIELQQLLVNKNFAKFYSKNSRTDRIVYGFLFPKLQEGMEDLLDYHFLNISGTADNFTVDIVVRMDFSLFQEMRSATHIVAIYKANMIQKSGVFLLDCSLRTDKMFHKKIGKIDFYSEDKENISSINKKKLKQYIDKVSKLFDLKNADIPSLTYIIGNRSNALNPLGFSHHSNLTGMNFGEEGLLISVQNTYLDEHELTHYLLKKFKSRNRFLNEGIAVYLGGSNGMSADEYVKEDVRLFNLLTSTEQKMVISEFLKGETLPKQDAQFYALSYLIIQKLVEKQGSGILLQLMEDFSNFTPREIIEQFQLFDKTKIELELRKEYQKYR